MEPFKSLNSKSDRVVNMTPPLGHQPANGTSLVPGSARGGRGSERQTSFDRISHPHLLSLRLFNNYDCSVGACDTLFSSEMSHAPRVHQKRSGGGGAFVA